MRLACQDNLVPGSSYREKLERLARCGYDGMELHGAPLLDRDRLAEAVEAFRGRRHLGCAAICAGFRGSLLSAQAEERELAVRDIRALLEVAARLEAVGLIVVPVLGREPQLPDLTPWRSAVELEWELLTVLWSELAAHAAQLGTLLVLEPLMRYQTYLINRLDQGAALLRRVGDGTEFGVGGRAAGTALMADFFHMNVEETDISAALQTHLPLLAHVHLSDSNRRLAGLGHMDFAAGLRVLREGGYRGYLSQEAVLEPGDLESALKHSATWLRAQMGG